MFWLVGGEYRGHLGWYMKVVDLLYNSSDLGVICRSRSSLCVNRHIAYRWTTFVFVYTWCTISGVRATLGLSKVCQCPRPITYALSINTSSHHQILVPLLVHSIVMFKVLIDHVIILLMLLPWPMPFDPLCINHSHISAPVQVHVRVPGVFSCVYFAHYPGRSLNCHWCISFLLWSIFFFSLFSPIFEFQYQLGLISFDLLWSLWLSQFQFVDLIACLFNPYLVLDCCSLG